MKINPPRAAIGKEDPFENTLFGRKDFAESLTRLLRNVDESLVIFVNAPWGEGKTTFARMWQKQLQDRDKLEVIYFDAYAADYFDDPFVSFSGEILELADKKLLEGKGNVERQEFKETAIEIGKRLTGLAAKVGLKALTLNAVDSTHIEELKEIATGISEIGADVIEKKIENYGVEKDALKKFKESLARLAAKIREEQKFPLTIIVDELDRCRPDFALGLLERIKHLFDVEGVAFVLLVNRAQIESYIKTIYGNADAEAYLLKFGNIFVDLPHQEANGFLYQPGRKEFCTQLYNHFEFSKRAQDSGFLITCSTVFAIHFGLTLREIEKAFVVMAIYYGSLSNNQVGNPLLVALLSMLKIKNNSLYEALNNKSVTANEFYQQTKFHQIKDKGGENFSFDRVKDILDYCLLSDAELKSLSVDRQNSIMESGRWVSARRLSAIQLLCAQLDRFSYSPK